MIAPSVTYFTLNLSNLSRKLQSITDPIDDNFVGEEFMPMADHIQALKNINAKKVVLKRQVIEV